MTPTLSRRLTRLVLYLLLSVMAIFYLLPVYVLLVTGLKSFAEVDLQRMWTLPTGIYFDNFIAAYEKLAPNLWNSLRMVVPAALISSVVGSVNGYVFSKWKFRFSELIFTLLLCGMFIPYQSILIPLVQFMEWVGLRGSITGLVMVHVIYGIAITTLIFRNYYAGVPTEVLEAGRMDGAGLFGLYRYIVFPLSIPAFVVVLIWQFTQAYNDFLFAVVLTNNRTWPVTVALNNLAGSQIVQWNVQMAGALITALPTLLVYIFLGRYFLRGLMAGALKG
jgi:glucose/mannose transport system permease protein